MDRRIPLTAVAAGGGMLAAAFLSTAVAVADDNGGAELSDNVFTTDNFVFDIGSGDDAGQIESLISLPPLLDVGGTGGVYNLTEVADAPLNDVLGDAGIADSSITDVLDDAGIGDQSLAELLDLTEDGGGLDLKGMLGLLQDPLDDVLQDKLGDVADTSFSDLLGDAGDQSLGDLIGELNGNNAANTVDVYDSSGDTLLGTIGTEQQQANILGIESASLIVTNTNPDGEVDAGDVESALTDGDDAALSIGDDADVDFDSDDVASALADNDIDFGGDVESQDVIDALAGSDVASDLGIGYAADSDDAADGVNFDADEAAATLGGLDADADADAIGDALAGDDAGLDLGDDADLSATDVGDALEGSDIVGGDDLSGQDVIDALGGSDVASVLGISADFDEDGLADGVEFDPSEAATGLSDIDVSGDASDLPVEGSLYNVTNLTAGFDDMFTNLIGGDIYNVYEAVPDGDGGSDITDTLVTPLGNFDLSTPFDALGNLTPADVFGGVDASGGLFDDGGGDLFDVDASDGGMEDLFDLSSIFG